MTETWVDTDGTDILLNTVEGFQKVRNLRRDPRVALNIADPEDPSRYFAVRGRVSGITDDGARAHIEALSQKYLGAPTPGSAAVTRFGSWSRSSPIRSPRRRADPPPGQPAAVAAANGSAANGSAADGSARGPAELPSRSVYSARGTNPAVICALDDYIR